MPQRALCPHCRIELPVWTTTSAESAAVTCPVCGENMKAASPNRGWYLQRGNQKSGPLSAGQLRDLARRGQIKTTDLLWRKGLSAWMPAHRVKGLLGETTVGAGEGRVEEPNPGPAEDTIPEPNNNDPFQGLAERYARPPSRPRNQRPRHIPLWTWVAAAGCVFTVGLFVLMIPLLTRSTDRPTLVAHADVHRPTDREPALPAAAPPTKQDTKTDITLPPVILEQPARPSGIVAQPHTSSLPPRETERPAQIHEEKPAGDAPPARQPMPNPMPNPMPIPRPEPQPADAPAPDFVEVMPPAGKEALGRIVYLQPAREAGTATPVIELILPREIVRQALLLSAREELGLGTRDAALGEPIPDGLPENERLHVGSVVNGRLSRCVVSRGPAARREVLTTDERTVPGGTDAIDHVALIVWAEQMSRKESVAALRKAGFAGKPNRKSAAAVPDSAEKLLSEMTFTAQYAAVRELHGLIRSQGESPALLGALVRAYANLGVQCEYHWYPSSKVFKARALLYAQRMVAADPASPSALWHRSYALALTGLHGAALADLDAAARLPSVQTDKIKQPAWVGLIAAFARFDVEGITQAGKEQGLASLAGLLRYLATEDFSSPNLTIETGQAVLRSIPECFRIHDALSRAGGVANQHNSTLAGAAVLSKTLSGRLQAMPGLPASAGRLLQQRGAEPRIVRALLDAGRDRTDLAEPSWSVLGRLTQEVRFVQVVGRLEFMRYGWSVPVDDYVKEALPLVAGHPCEALVRSFGIDPQRDRQAFQQMVTRVPLTDPSVVQHALYFAYLFFDPTRHATLYFQARANADPIRPDTVAMFRYLPASPDKAKYARALLATCPSAPVAQAALIELNWPAVENQAQEWEKVSRHPSVLRALGKQYAAMGRIPDAERCLQQSLAISADKETYTLLADAYKAQGKTDLWLQTLEAFLRQPDVGLEHAQVRVAIAREFMRDKDYAKAKPYAEAAAQSWANWAMECAVECYTGLQQWKEAELWVRRQSERYPDACHAWFFWCVRTGKGDPRAAQQLVAQHLQTVGNRANIGDLSLAGAFYAVINQPQKSVEAFEAIRRQTPADSIALFLIAGYDDLGKTEQRDRLIQELASLNSPFGRLARVYQAALEKGKNGLPDSQAIEDVLGGMSAKLQADACYFIGRFLARRGDAKGAAEYLTRCTTAAEPQTILIQTLAMDALRKSKPGTDGNRP